MYTTEQPNPYVNRSDRLHLFALSRFVSFLCFLQLPRALWLSRNMARGGRRGGGISLDAHVLLRSSVGGLTCVEHY